MTKMNEKARILLSVVLIASLMAVFSYGQGADLTLDAVQGVYNAQWLNGTNGALQTGLYVDLIDEFSLASGVTIDGVLMQDGEVVALTINTGQGSNELYSMNQDVETTDGVTFLTVDTGQGANELYDMDQNVLIASSPTFAGLIINGKITMGDEQAIRTGVNANDWFSLQAWDTDGGIYTGVLRIQGGVNVPYAAIESDKKLLFRDTGIWIQSTANGVLMIEADGQVNFGSPVNNFPGVNKIQFRDGQISMNSGTDGHLDLFADVSVDINSPDLVLSDNIIPDANNTGSVGEDAIRFADGYFVTVTAKNTVTGKIIENEITANPLESFEAGDLVMIMDGEYFTKTTNKLANVIGVVTLNPGNIQTGTETVTSWVDETRDVTRSVSWIEEVTDAYGQVYEIQRSQEDPVYEWYLEMVEETLSDGNAVIYYENRTRIKTETVQVEVSTEIPIMEPKNEPVLCVFGKAPVKISEPVIQGDVLVASGVDGMARPLRTVLPEILEQYGDLEMTPARVITVFEKLNYKTLGRVMEDSEGGFAWVMVGY